ncbi:MAG: hypothetical protein JXR41_06190 [Bacteroidales bacterium]|nr:hypothetical protein [Bacteroidales bacterium]MBN2762660.1 hypothetical protein [Bacteroidales bacterium]
MMKKYNSVGFGIAAGIVLPVIVYMVLYFAKVQDVRYTLFSDYTILSSILPVLISHCILPNIILFFIFNWLDAMLSAKGVVIATVILAAGVFITKMTISLL